MKTKNFYLRRYTGRTRKLRKFFEKTEGCDFKCISSCRKYLVFTIPKAMWVKWSNKGNLMIDGKIINGI